MHIDFIEVCAEHAYEVNREYCQALGDNSQPTWKDAPAWQRNSIRDGAFAVLHGVSNADRHAGWMHIKGSEGWKYGPVKDVENKLHPCMLPYDRLPPAERFKDTLFAQSVRAAAYGEIIDHVNNLAELVSTTFIVSEHNKGLRGLAERTSA